MGDGSPQVLQVAEGASGMTSRDRHARLRAQACHIRVRQGQVLQGCARDTSGRVETGIEHTGQRTTARPSVHGAQRVDHRPRETPATVGVGS